MAIDPATRLLLRRGYDKKELLVLMYHSLTPGNTADSRWAVSARDFREQVKLLGAEGWTTACVSDLLRSDILSPRTAIITFDDGYADNFDSGFRVLADYGMTATWFVVSRDIGKMSGWTDTGVPARQMLSTSQLTEMAAAGMEIGAHTRTHARMTELDGAAMREEVAGSRKDLEDVLGRPVTSFAYPYGLFNDRCVEAVREAGFAVACTTRPGRFLDELDLLRVRRVGIFANDNLSVFARKLVFADYDVSWKRLAGRLVNHFRGNADPGDGSY